MSKISFYQVMNGEILKSSCMLLEKCFQNNFKTFVQVSNEEDVLSLDKTLWTFSQKAFIPHCTNLDPMPEKHPIYISHEDICPIDANILMLIERYRLDIKEYERVLIMLDGTIQADVKQSMDTMNELKNLGHEVEYYRQNAKLAWEKISE